MSRPRAALERTAARGLSIGFGAAALAGQDVGNHVVAERRVLRVRRELDALARERDRFVEVLFLIEIRLRQEQVALREARIHLDGLLERVDLPAPIADALVDTAQIERCLVTVGM